jgi:hypothetical protein
MFYYRAAMRKLNNYIQLFLLQDPVPLLSITLKTNEDTRLEFNTLEVMEMARADDDLESFFDKDDIPKYMLLTSELSNYIGELKFSNTFNTPFDSTEFSFPNLTRIEISRYGSLFDSPLRIMRLGNLVSIEIYNNFTNDVELEGLPRLQKVIITSPNFNNPFVTRDTPSLRYVFLGPRFNNTVTLSTNRTIEWARGVAQPSGQIRDVCRIDISNRNFNNTITRS